MIGGNTLKIKLFRHLTLVNNLIILFQENIFVIDNGYDQIIINIHSFLVQPFADIHYSVGGALISMNPSSLELVNEAFYLSHPS